MKKILILQFMILIVGIGFSQNNIEKKPNGTKLSFDNFNGFAMLDTVQNVVTVTEYYSSKSPVNTFDTAGFSIPLLKIANDTSLLLPGQKEFLQSLKELSEITLHEMYIIWYLNSSPDTVYLEIVNWGFDLMAREIEDIMGAFWVRNKVFFVMNGKSTDPSIFLNMLKDTGDSLNIAFRYVPQEAYLYMIIDIRTDVIGCLDSTKFDIIRSVVKNKILKGYD